MILPQIAPSPPTGASSHVDDEPDGLNRNTFIILWSFVGVFVFAGVLFVIWHSHSTHQAEIKAANDRLSKAVASTNDWLRGKSPLDGEAVEQTLADALKEPLAMKNGDGESLLRKIQQRREEMAEDAAIEQARRQTTIIWNDAQRQIEGKRITEAIKLLRQYVADPHATEKLEAQQLLVEAETAISDLLVFDALVDMTDKDFNQVKAAGEIRHNKVTHPVLLSVHNETVKRNIERAVQRREEIRIAEEKHREAERMAAIERQRQEEEKRQTDEERRQAKLRAKQEAAEKLRWMQENPSLTPQLEDVANFPDRYMGNYVRFKGIQVLGDIERSQFLNNMFCVPLRSSRNKYFTGIGDELIVTTTDRMAESLLNSLKDNEKFISCDVYCEITQFKRFDKMVTQARVYRIEVYTVGGNIREIFTE